MKIKHSVLMITYNHEKYIRESLDSVFNNLVLPDEVILHDDCSIDQTWNIVLEFKERYPNILSIYRHNVNIGIFQNLNSLLRQGTGDVITWLSGDDYLLPGCFEELNKVIEDNNIDIKHDKFIIVTNTAQLNLDGTMNIFDNYKLKEKNIFKERLRYGVSYREVGISNNIYSKISPFRYDLGLHADWLYSLEIDSLCEKYYFTPFVSSVYRVGVGTVSKTKYFELIDSRNKVLDVVLKTYNDRLDKKDRKYLKYEKSYCKLALHYSIKNFFFYLFLLLANIFNFSINNQIGYNKLTVLLSPKIKQQIRRFFKRINNTVIANL